MYNFTLTLDRHSGRYPSRTKDFPTEIDVSSMSMADYENDPDKMLKIIRHRNNF